jgi:hypothetical protein
MAYYKDSFLKNRAVLFEFEVLTTVTIKSIILWDVTQ